MRFLIRGEDGALPASIREFDNVKLVPDYIKDVKSDLDPTRNCYLFVFDSRYHSDKPATVQTRKAGSSRWDIVAGERFSR